MNEQCGMSKVIPTQENVYRTERFIVCQYYWRERICKGGKFVYFTASSDVYIARNARRDRQFEMKYRNRIYLEGVRIPVDMSMREYVR